MPTMKISNTKNRIDVLHPIVRSWVGIVWAAGRRLASGEATQVGYQQSRESMQRKRTRPSARSGKILSLCEIFPQLDRVVPQEPHEFEPPNRIY